MILKIAVSLIPVILFLILLISLDSLKLVNHSILLLCLLWGILSAGLSFLINTFFIDEAGIDFQTYSEFFAPFVEEFLKLVMLVILIKKNKTGFMIDAAIYGFAIGAAFAFSENLCYFFLMGASKGSLMIWITRGFGTAIMHGGTTSIAAIIIISAWNKEENLISAGIIAYCLAIMIHGIYNLFLVSPYISTGIVVLLIPAIILFMFRKNQQSIRKWMELEFDIEVKLLVMIKSGTFAHTRSGKFLISLRDHFSKEMVVDIYCYVSLYLELSIKAKGLLLLREQDFPVPRDPEITEKLHELDNLKKQIGKAGLLVIAPVFRVTRKDLWQLSLLNP